MLNTLNTRRAGYALAFAGLVALNVVGRLASETPNVTPIAASALFAAFIFRNRFLAAGVPLVSMLLTDAFSKGFYDLPLMLVVYAALIFPVLLRRVVGEKINPWRIGGASFIGSVVFYVSTNLAEWLWMGHYSSDWTGLVACFAAALPFFKNTVAGDLAWCTTMFGGLAAVNAIRARLAARATLAAA